MRPTYSHVSGETNQPVTMNHIMINVLTLSIQLCIYDFFNLTLWMQLAKLPSSLHLRGKNLEEILVAMRANHMIVNIH